MDDRVSEDSARAVPRRAELPRAALFVDAAFALLLAVLALAPLWPVYQSGRMILVALVASGVGVGIGVIGLLGRRPLWTLVLGALLAYLLLGVPLAVPSQALLGVLPSAEGLLSLLQAPVTAWKQLLTIGTPVGDYQALLVPVLLLGLGAGLASMLLARYRRPGPALLPSALVLLIAILFSTKEGWWAAAIGAAYLALALLWMALRRLSFEGLSGFRIAPTRALGALLVLGIAGAGAAGLTAVLPSGQREVLREAIEPPFDPRSLPSPLATFRSWFQDGAAEAALFRVEGLPEGERLRLAVLDRYDGVVYSVGSGEEDPASGLYQRIPGALAPEPDDGAETVTVSVEVLDYRGSWLPMTGAPQTVDFDSPASEDAFVYNRSTGTAASTAPIGAGDRYRISTIFAEEQALGAPGSADQPPLPPLPADLDNALQALLPMDGAPGTATADPAALLEAALLRLAGDGYLSHGREGEPISRSGHSFERMLSLFTDTPRLGDQEQYTVAAALIARSLGYPVRIVVGFVAEGSAGVREFTGEDATAWIEVRTAGAWVPVDVTATRTELPEELPEETHVVSRPETVVPPPVDPSAEDPRDPEQELLDPAEPQQDGLAAVLGVLGTVGLGLVGLLMLASPLLVILGVKARRRRRRERLARERGRILGGWAEARAAMLDHGFEFPVGATRRQLATEFNSPALVRLAQLADHAAYAPEEPTAWRARQAWEDLREFEAGLNAPLGRWQRLRVATSPFSLFAERRGRGSRRGRPAPPATPQRDGAGRRP